VNRNIEEQTKQVAEVLLEVGSLLMSSGASTERIRITVQRIAKVFKYDIDLMLTHRAILLTITDDSGEHLFSRIKRISPHGVNFKLVSGLSHLSWNVKDNEMSVEEVATEIVRLKSLKHYPRFLVIIAVGVADAGFCRMWDGGYKEMLIAFIATIIGIYIRQETTKRKYNPYICVYFAALSASIISGCADYFNLAEKSHIAFSTSILFLVPGVPLINSITDLIDGNILNALVRGMNGLLIAFFIAMGMFTVKLLLNI